MPSCQRRSVNCSLGHSPRHSITPQISAESAIHSKPLVFNSRHNGRQNRMSCLPDDRSAPASKVNRAFSARHLAAAESWDAVPGSPRRIRPVADFNMNAAPLALNTYQTRCLCHAFPSAGNARSSRLRVPKIVDLRRRTRSNGHSPHPTCRERAGAHSS